MLPRQSFDFRALLQRRDLINTIVVTIFFIAIGGMALVWSQRTPRVYVGQIMTDTRLKRVDFEVVDQARTQRNRELARERAPRVYRLNDEYLSQLESALTGLPVALDGRDTLEEVSAKLRQEFNLTPEALTAMQPFVLEGRATEQWRTWVQRLVRQTLIEHPIVESEAWQVELTRNSAPEFRAGERVLRPDPDDSLVIELNNQKADLDAAPVQRVVEMAGFPRNLVPVVASRIAHNAQPIFIFDARATQTLQEAVAKGVPNVLTEHQAGEIIYRRGETLTAPQLELIEIEQARYREIASMRDRFSAYGGVFGLVALVGAFVAGYLLAFYPRIVRNPWRLTAIFGLMLGLLGGAIALTGHMPQLEVLAAISATTFFSLVLVIAYDRRLALVLTAMLATLVVLAINQTVAFFLFLIVSAGMAAARMAEVRHRNSLIRAASASALVAGCVAVLIGLYEIPAVPGAWRAIAGNAGWAVAGSLAVGFFLLGLLPTIERVFDITTGMTLVELRDPKNPLLRQLQERAPGTYTHSLTVATIAENAADSIGANTLLVYVGALYHDIGKMNKPDYFVENQSGGPNKHEKLSPAMSLLVIVGHVKDGVEMAREFGLPRVILHFIESHHGTTLVEYFYHTAKKSAEEKGDRVTELEYRYPGPKPRTKEAAILMLSDACESASRAMAEPTPASIENLVRKLSRKRLTDGQFDECELTFRELRQLEDSIIRSIWSLHHGRITYPTDEPERISEPQPALVGAGAGGRPRSSMAG